MKTFVLCCVHSGVVHSLGISCGDKTNASPAVAVVALMFMLSLYSFLECPQAQRETTATAAAKSCSLQGRLPVF